MMQATMAYFFVLGLVVMAAFHVTQNTPPSEAAHADAVAINFAIYRRAVNIHALATPGVSGTISQPILGLPSEWVSLRPWTNVVEGGRCYVYGPATIEEIQATQKLLRGSLAIGVNLQGALVPSDGVTSIVLPSSIPDGSLVSVIGL